MVREILACNIGVEGADCLGAREDLPGDGEMAACDTGMERPDHPGAREDLPGDRVDID